ncbi:MAG: branched-chain amino acid ABC transporter permease [Syntrophorhabdales bacterium]
MRGKTVMTQGNKQISSGKRLVFYAPVLLVLLFFAGVPWFLDTPIVSLITKVLCFGLLAMSVDIAFGYTGLWTFGHAAIFGVAAYTCAIVVMTAKITSFWIAAPLGIIAAAVVSAIFAAVAARSSGLYFLLITFALGQLVYSVAVQWKSVTHGDDGLWGIPYPDIAFSLSSITYYYFTLVIVVGCALLLYCFTRSPFGYSLVGIRENEVRARTMGYNAGLRKIIGFVVSGLFAGLAGILYVYFNGGIAPENVGMAASGMATIMVIIGGTGTLWGAFLGSGVVLLLQYFISLVTPSRWPIFLGAIFIAAVFFARDGIFPRLVNIWKKVIGYGDIDG